MTPIPISDLRSNWQFVVFYLIEPLVNNKNRTFSSSQVIGKAEEIHQLLAIRFHKERIENFEGTLYKTLQNMRDKHWINFLDFRGEYKYELTDEGYKILLRIKERIRHIRNNKAELLKKAAERLEYFRKAYD
jgi:DNA-binding PadR family transcriptional regulator